jgi:eukaryotic-like serine/threonine-protein kinase
VASDDYIGKTVARKYRVEALIGEGGMGKVYKATQLILEKPVVLKVLRQALLSDERTVARFQREAKAASRLNHANSISILDFGQAEDGAMYIAMEYVSGKDLHHILSREWPLPEARVIRIVSQVLSALSDAHGAGVIHRDLKPENIMVEQRRGEPDFVKVLDFGIAKITDSSGEDGPALTRAGFVCGTPEYMSPEQARGATLDHRSDLYAVGVILYQLTTGMLPFDSESAVGFATKHLTEQPPLPSRRRPEARISQQLERLIMKTLAKSPDDRPQTAEQFRAELLAIDKEARGGGRSPRRSSTNQGSGRRFTPVEEQQTRVTSGPVSDPGWGQDTTQRADSALARPGRESAARSGASPFAVADRTAFHDRYRPGGAAISGLASTDPVGRKPESGGLAFKILTVVLVLIAIGVAGAFIHTVMKQKDEEAVFIPPPNAPVKIKDPNAQPAIDFDRLWEQQVPEAMRDATSSSRLNHDGDAAWRRGDSGMAITKYKEAFSRDPSSEVALKLGELYYQQDELAEARNWWIRHLADAPSSKARAYIQQVMPEK